MLHNISKLAKERKLNLIEVGILERLKKNRGRVLTIDLISKNLIEQDYIYKYIDGLTAKGLIEKVGEDKYRVMQIKEHVY